METKLERAKVIRAISPASVAVHLFAWHYSSLSPRVELETMRSSLHFADSKDIWLDRTELANPSPASAAPGALP